MKTIFIKTIEEFGQQLRPSCERQIYRLVNVQLDRRKRIRPGVSPIPIGGTKNKSWVIICEFISTQKKGRKKEQRETTN